MSYFNYGDTPSVMLDVQRDIIELLSKKYTGRAVKTPVYNQDATDAVNMVENIIDLCDNTSELAIQLRASTRPTPARGIPDARMATVPPARPARGRNTPPAVPASASSIPRPVRKRTSSDPIANQVFDDDKDDDATLTDSFLQSDFGQFSLMQEGYNQRMIDIASARRGDEEALRAEAVVGMFENVNNIAEILDDLIRDRGLSFVPKKTMTKLDQSFSRLSMTFQRVRFADGAIGSRPYTSAFDGQTPYATVRIWFRLDEKRSQVFELWDMGK